MNAVSHRCSLVAWLSLLMLAACAREGPPVTYADVKPIFDQYCVPCHKPGQPGHEASGLALGSYDDVMKGTRFGPVVLPGDPRTSVLMMLVEGRVDPSIRMPHGDAPQPSQAEIDRLRTWIAQGAQPD